MPAPRTFLIAAVLCLMSVFCPVPTLPRVAGAEDSAAIAGPVVNSIEARQAAAVSFRHDVMPVLSKTGCNLGTCHGNANGKGGLKLSLRGDDPDGDYLTLTRSLTGRRANPLQPDRSLLLLKPTMQVPHQGGRRFAVDSREYQILRSWIADGLPDDSGQVATVASLTVTPGEILRFGSRESISLKVIARFGDGRKRDVTRLAVYEPASPIVEVSSTGQLRPLEFGETTILVRYLSAQHAVRVAWWPAREDFRWRGPESDHPLDIAVFGKLKRHRLNPAEVCDDTTFLRRVYFDLLGLPPTAVEAKAFLDDDDPQKRSRVVQELLQRPEFADNWSLKWADLLRVEEKTLDRKGTQVFHAWIRRQLSEDRPLNQFTQELISARGSTYKNPPANFWRALRDPQSRAEATAQVFLGIRLQCARCHNHPFDRWTQTDYYRWTNLFANVDYKILQNKRGDKNDKHEFNGEQIVFIKSKPGVKHPQTGQVPAPGFLGEQRPLVSGQDRLTQLASWLAADNPRFARTQANRIWYQLLGQGVIDPIDDVRETNPAINDALLQELTRAFIHNDFRLKPTLQWIMSSRVYQLRSLAVDVPEREHIIRNFGGNRLRRLPAEQLIDAMSLVLEAPVEFNGYPAGTRATQLAGVRAVRRRDKRPTAADKFLTLFGKPPRLQTCECERSDDATLAQMFQLVSGPLMQELLSSKQNRLTRLLKGDHADAEIVNEIYWATLTRPPTSRERAACVNRLQQGDRRRALEDIVWALLNSNEFLLRR